MAASARDIIPIALAGLAGALGGPQAAAGINNAAQTSRQMGLDKRNEEDRTVKLAQSARQLELAEEAGKRAEKGLKLETSRQDLLNKKTQLELKESEKAIARFENSRQSYQEYIAEAIPDLPESYRWLVTEASSPTELNQAMKAIAKYTQTLTPEQAKEKASDARASGVGGRFDFEGGSYYASGGQGGGKAGVTARRVQRVINSAMDDYPDVVMDLEGKKASLQDKANKALESGNTKTANQLNARIRAIDQRIQGANTPRGMWGNIEERLDKLGLDDDSIAQIEEQFWAGQGGAPGDSAGAAGGEGEDAAVDAAVARAQQEAGMPGAAPPVVDPVASGGVEIIQDPITGERRRRGALELGAADNDAIAHTARQFMQLPKDIWQGARKLGENLRNP